MVLSCLFREQPVAKRNSQQGKAKPNKPVIHVTLSLKEDVKLRETENAWKPDRMKPPCANEGEAETEVCIKNSVVASRCVEVVSTRNVLNLSTDQQVL
jgi:translation initiation factor 4G